MDGPQSAERVNPSQQIDPQAIANGRSVELGGSEEQSVQQVEPPTQGTLSKQRRNKVCLTMEKKIELLKRLEKKEKVKDLIDEYKIGRSTIYDLKRDKVKIFKEIERCDSKEILKKRKNISNSVNSELDQILYEWVKQKRNEGTPLTGLALKTQAEYFNEELNYKYRTKPLKFSSGWLTRFTTRHGLKYITTSGDKLSTDTVGAENFIIEFELFRHDNKLCDEQIFNCDESGIFWKYIGRKTFALHTENKASGFKDNKDRLTVLACANQAGTFKSKLVVIGKAKNPRAFKGARIPISWYSSKNAWMTEQIFINWITNEFLPEAREHLRQVGLGHDSKIVLTFDNCSAHPSAEFLENLDPHKQLIVKPLPPNVTPLIQPMDQGILRSLKCKYKTNHMTSMLDALNRGETIITFVRGYNVLHAVYGLHTSWLDVPQSTLKNGWKTFRPPQLHSFDVQSVSLEPQEPYQGFGSQSPEEQHILTEILDYNERTIDVTRVSITREDVIDVMDADINAPTVRTLSDSEIIDSVMGGIDEQLENDSFYGDRPGFEGEGNVSIEELIDTCSKLLIGIQERPFITDAEVTGVYKIKERLMKKQSTLKYVQTKMDQYIKKI